MFSLRLFVEHSSVAEPLGNLRRAPFDSGFAPRTLARGDRSLPTVLTEQSFEPNVILSKDSLCESAVEGRARSKKLELSRSSHTSQAEAKTSAIFEVSYE